MSNVTEVVDGMIDIIKRNIIARTNLTSNINIGDRTIYVTNSFHFNAGEEIIIIDNGYNEEGDPHYQVFEYAQIKTVNSTTSITLSTAALSNWTVAKSSFIQKTIGHSPLYEDNVLYGDREVIPTDLMAVCVEPVGVDNEWIYIQGGLSEEYKLKIIIYGKDVKTDEGMKVLNKYSDAVYKLLNKNLHIGVDIKTSPLLEDALNGTNQVIIEDNETNRENFVLSSTLRDPNVYVLQDNTGRSCPYFSITNISISGGRMTITLGETISGDYTKNEFGIFVRFTRYFYDSRVNSVQYGVVQKGSAILRAAELSWFGKEVDEYSFPQTYKNIPTFNKIT